MKAPDASPHEAGCFALRNPYRVAYLDLDGTLTRDGSLFQGADGVTLDGALAVARLHQAAIEIVPCSGRTVRQLAEVARILGARTFVAELGSVVAYDGGARVKPALVDQPDAARLKASGVAEAVMRSFDLEWHAPWHLAREYTLLFRGRADVAKVRELLDRDYAALHLTCVDNGPVTDDGKHAYHVLPDGVDKGRAVSRDRLERGIPREACLSFGDSEGDLAMAAEVGRHYWVGGRPSPGRRLPPNVRATRQRFAEGLLEAVADALERGRRSERPSR